MEEIRKADGTLYARYVYDSWGNTVKILDANGNTVTDPDYLSVQNPIRYRGYYWDSESGLYYLQSRYYDPVTGRFVNPDTIALTLVSTGSVTDKNLYSYCDNNPVMRSDLCGGIWQVVLAGAAVGGALEFASQLIENKGDIKSLNWTNIGIATVSGGLSASFGVFGGALVDGAATALMDIVEGERDGGALLETFATTTVSSLAIGGTLSVATKGLKNNMLNKTSKRKIKQKVNSLYPEIKGKDINSYKNLNILKKECPKVVESIVAPVNIASNTIGQLSSTILQPSRTYNVRTTLKAKGVRGYTM